MYKYIKGFLQAWTDYPLQPGSYIGDRYKVISPIGLGSYGITYRCLDEQHQQTVAVKQAKPSKKGTGQQMLAWEKEVMSALEHPFIPACRDFFEEKRSVSLVIDYIEGKTLEDSIFAEGRTFGERDTVNWTLQLMERVKYIHDKGFVHLDLRIPNVIMKEDQLYLIDFGLSAPLGNSGSDLYKQIKAGFNSTTPSKPAMIQSDLYDIGHLMLFMLYSQFSPEPDAPEAGWMEELQLSGELREILLRLLEEGNPYPDTSGFVSDLERILPGLR
ncbi:protein kinase family protein [Paenibacillus sp. PK3_47]|uniref:serine/threonine protein kinase n=1 Tax=Paenibacillus sp. PK3_47 TaxID=2072642 RepID=UPI00201E4B99|nr:protein kinase family protein [Paenibacillus sp. PK3_47]